MNENMSHFHSLILTICRCERKWYHRIRMEVNTENFVHNQISLNLNKVYLTKKIGHDLPFTLGKFERKFLFVWALLPRFFFFFDKDSLLQSVNAKNVWQTFFAIVSITKKLCSCEWHVAMFHLNFRVSNPTLVLLCQLYYSVKLLNNGTPNP